MANRSIVGAAARQDSSVLRFGVGSLRDESAINFASALPECISYQGEALRLVGPFNDWRTTDPETRFVKLIQKGDLSKDADESVWGYASERACIPKTHAYSAKRHQLSIHLFGGWIAFQII